MKMLHTVDLDGFEKRLPKEMSGGQRQRVALARAMVIEPDLMLFDEPLSNLDAKLRVQMRVEIRKLQQELGFTAIYVTHDQEECFAISDKVAIMNHGVIEQLDRPEEIYAHPKTEFIAHFVGFENFIDLKHSEGTRWTAADGSVLEIAHPEDGRDTTRACIRPDDILVAAAGEDVANAVAGKVGVRTYLGKRMQYNVETALGELIVNTSNDRLFDVGENITLSLDAAKIVMV